MKDFLYLCGAFLCIKTQVAVNKRNINDITIIKEKNMGLRIIVLAKQVPDTRNVGKDAMKEDGTINRAALPAIFNPEDLNALEQALQLKDAHPGSTITLGGGAELTTTPLSIAGKSLILCRKGFNHHQTADMFLQKDPESAVTFLYFLMQSFQYSP